MPRKLAIIEIETGGDERLCGECSQLVCDGRNPVYCAAFGALERKPASFVRFRAPACLESTRLASLDRAVVEAAKALRDDDNSWPKEQALQAAVDERRKAND